MAGASSAAPGTPPSSLATTGERTVPGAPREQYWFARHLVAYAAVADAMGARIAGARVVDAGVGEGYGAELLRRAGAGPVIGLDYDDASTAHAHRRYPRIAVARANLAALPLADASVDAIVSLQVIEHLWSLPEFIADCARAIRPGGTLVVTTPNRPVFSPGLARGERPANPFHVEEFDAAQVAALLRGAGLAGVRVQGLIHVGALAAWEADHGSIVAAQIEAVRTGTWGRDLETAVAAVTAADFAVVDLDREGRDRADRPVHDLIGWAGRCA